MATKAIRVYDKGATYSQQYRISDFDLQNCDRNRSKSMQKDRVFIRERSIQILVGGGYRTGSEMKSLSKLVMEGVSQ
jgi:phosphoribosylformimino-5-aminoimidazole carboxamide ribonucleotide (ProFAR) isomerase